MNEMTWQHVLQWEQLHAHECGQPTLLRFLGRPHELRWGTCRGVSMGRNGSVLETEWEREEHISGGWKDRDKEEGRSCSSKHVCACVYMCFNIYCMRSTCIRSYTYRKCGQMSVALCPCYVQSKLHNGEPWRWVGCVEMACVCSKGDESRGVVAGVHVCTYGRARACVQKVRGWLVCASGFVPDRERARDRERPRGRERV